ncbi:MAG: hypothetical protein ACAI35_13635 [Candidatus Methylacidiphilales bacterium]|nr:hypothetical protein [Candidatus Methylacidiphilales bacterium]
MSLLQLLCLAAGIFMLIAGRRLYTFLIAVVGFMLGLEVATYFGADTLSESARATTALIAGTIGVLLIRYIQGAAIIVGGALGGAYVGLSMASLVSAALKAHLKIKLPMADAISSSSQWLGPVIAVLAGAAIGTVLLWYFFDWSVILLSSACGAFIIVDVLHFSPGFKIMMVLTLTATGTYVQGMRMLNLCSTCLAEAET